MSGTTYNWLAAASGRWFNAANWAPTATPSSATDAADINAAGDYGYTVSLGNGDPLIGIAALSVSTPATLDIEGAGGTETISGNASNTGNISVDTGYLSGGSGLSVGAALTGTGTLEVGSATLNGPVTVTIGSFGLTGSTSVTGNGANQASLVIESSAPSTLSSSFALSDNAVLQFASGSIGTIASNVTLSLAGGAVVADAGSTSTSSALTALAAVAGSLDLEYGATAAISADLSDTGTLTVDDDYLAGGSSLAIAGTLSDDGTLNIGSGSLNAATSVSVGNLAVSGRLDITGNGANQASLLVGSPIGSTLTGAVQLSGDALLQYASGSLTTIASGSSLYVGGNARVADAGSTSTNSALTGLATIAGSLELENGAGVAITDDLNDTGTLNIDTGYLSGSSGLSISGLLTDAGTLNIGSGALNAATSVGVGNLAVSGRLDITGNGANQASLLVGSAIGNTLSGIVQLSGDALLQYASGSLTTIAGGSNLYLSGNSRIADAGSTSTNSALAGLDTVTGSLELENGAAIATTGDLDVTGTVTVDGAYLSGSSSLTVGGTLTDAGTLTIGSGSLNSATSVSAGNLTLTGRLNISGTGNNQASLLVGSAIGATLTGNVTLSSDALLQYASGSLTTIASGSSLYLGGDARIADAGSTSTNSALTGLNTVAGSLELENGAAVAATGDFDDTGTVTVDGAYLSGSSNLIVGGTLTDAGTLNIGSGLLNSATSVSAGNLAVTGRLNIFGTGNNQASLLVGSAIGATFTGNATLSSDALLQYASGSLTTIAGGSNLYLGGNSRIADAGSTSTNSALTGLNTVAGSLDLENGAAVAVAGDLDDTGTVTVDGGYLSGGSSLTVGGTLTDDGTLNIGSGALNTATTVTAGNLAINGRLNIAGTGTNQASLDVSSNIAETLSNNVTLTGDTLLQYGGGQLTTIAGTGYLGLFGNARVADVGSASSNSALTGLATVAGTFELESGASVAVTGDLADTGTIDVDTGYLSSGSALSIGGTLTDNGTLNVGSGALNGATTVTVGGLAGTGRVNVAGSNGYEATLAVTAAAGTTITTSISLSGTALLQYASGSFTTIAASGGLIISGPAVVADAGSTGSDTALSALGNVAGTLRLESGATLSLAGGLVNSGSLQIDQDYQGGGSSLILGGELTNAGSLAIGNAGAATASSVTVGLLTTSGTLTLNGPAGASSTLDVTANATASGNVTLSGVTTMTVGRRYLQSGNTLSLGGATLSAGNVLIASGAAATGYGTIEAPLDDEGIVTATGAVLDVTGAVTGAGQLAASGGGTLELGGGAAQTFTFGSGMNTLELGTPAAFTGTIDGLATGDLLTLLNTSVTGASTTYNANTQTSTLTLSVAGGGTLAYTLAGNYTGDAFSVSQAGGNSSVGFIVPAVPVINTASPIAFGAVHTGTDPTQTISISNTAGAGAPSLDASVGGTTGYASASGSIKQLAPGATNNGSISVGLNATTGGNLTGAATLDFASDAGGNTTAITPQTVTVTGTAYRLASARLASTPQYLHVGDPGSVTIGVTNADPADGFSESLQAAITGSTGGVSVTPGNTGLVAPGQTASSLTATVNTASAGQISGAVTAMLQSVATGADPLGTTNLGAEMLPVTVYVDNYAAAGLSETSGGGTVTQSGSTITVDLGTIAANSGPLALGLAASNTASGQADNLSGSFTANGTSGFSPTGLAAFAGLGAGQSDTQPTVTLDTSQLGAQTETITLTPTDSNPGGFSEALPAVTLVVKANVAQLPPPTISASQSLTAMATIPVLAGPITISDPNTLTGPVTVTLADTAGTLNATASGNAKLGGNGSSALTLTGSLADVNATLQSLTYTDPAMGSDTINVGVTDQYHASATSSIAVTTGSVPNTGAVLNSPAMETALIGGQYGLAGLSVSDPYAEANGQVISVTLNTPVGTLGVNNPPNGAMITGQGTGSITLTGTVAQINASLADDALLAESLAFPVIEYLSSVGLHTVSQSLINLIITGGVGTPTTADDYVSSLGGPGGKVFSLGVFLASAELNNIVAVITGGKGVSQATIVTTLDGIVADAHLEEADGTLLNFNPVGEFVFAASEQSGDSFDVQVRLQPLGNSQSASVVTQVAAALGNDRVTFGLGRDGFVWVDGAAVSLTQNQPDILSGGTLTQVSANKYDIVWSTGETLTVTDQGSYIDVQFAPGPNNGTGSIGGLATVGASGQDLTLPNGSVLDPTQLTTAGLAQFADSWRVPQQYSLLDYASGQTTATFTDTSFPEQPIQLSDLPASVVANAAAVAQSHGITDPGALAAAEFDYIASGGNTAFVADDASLFAGQTTNPAPVAESSPPPVDVGVIPDQTTVVGDGIDPINVPFDVYLTAAASSDTTVTYTVTGGEGDIDPSLLGSAATGTIVIPAGKTTDPFSIMVPAAALGTLASETLAVSVTASDGVGVFAGTAQETVAQPVAGPPPVPVFSDLTRLGTFTQSGNSYTLNLGDIQLGEPVPEIVFDLSNNAAANSDNLAGSFSVPNGDGFTVTGASLAGALAPRQSYDGLTVQVDYTKLGEDTQTITFSPQDDNNSGFSVPLPAETLTIEDNIVLPSMVYSQAWGDVHIVTYNGLRYDFQEVGEFTLAKSRVTGDSFDIQLRLQPYYSSATVSVITQAAVSLGTDRVTFDSTRADYVSVDGNAVTNLSATNPTMQLNGGTLNYISPTVYQVIWNTGEEATITNVARYINVSDGIPLAEPNSVGGLQGEDAGQANDFQLPDGTVLPQPLTYDQLHYEYADAWRVSQAASLFDYGPGQTTQTFTDENFPADVAAISGVPQAAQTEAASLIAAASITDPGIAAAAMEDYLATGDASFINSAAAVQQQVKTTTTFTPTNIPTPAPQVGLLATASTQTEAASGPTTVAFTAFLTSAATSDTTLTYTALTGGGLLTAAEYGGTVPSGSVVISAGQTTAPITITLPAGALGTAASGDVELQLTATSGPTILTPTATTTVSNSQAVAGIAPNPMLLDLTDPSALTQTSPTAYTLNVGTLGHGQAALLQQLAIQNGAPAGADALGGAFTAPLGSGFVVSGNSLGTKTIAAGDDYTGLLITADPGQTGNNTETLVYTPTDVNGSGYSATLAPITLTLTDTVANQAGVGLDTPNQIVFGNVHEGTTPTQSLTVTNTAAAPAQALDVNGVSGGSAELSGSISDLAAGQTDSSSLSVGLTTATAGVQTGLVLLQASSAGGVGGSTALPTSPSVDVYGTVYRLAAPQIAPINLTVHVGDPGTAALAVQNTDPADGYSEMLDATLAGTTGGITDPPATAQIAPDSMDSSDLTVGFSTAQAGTQSGTATVNLASDGTSTDGLGLTPLAAQTVPVNVTVLNYAQASLTSSGTLQPGTTANSFVLDLGTVQQGTTGPSVELDALNSAAAPADPLSGTWTVNSTAAFTNAGFGSFTNDAAGSTATGGSITLNSSQTGSFSETIVLQPTDTTTSTTLPNETVTVEGTVTPASTAPGGVTTTPASLVVQPGAPATAIGIIAPTDPNYSASQLTITAGSLPTDGTVTLANGTAVTTGEVLTSAQLTSLLFVPAAGRSNQTSSFTYTVADPANNVSAGTAALAIGAAVGNPTVASPSLTVAENAAAAAIGIAAPTDPNYAANQLGVTLSTLPTDGTVTLANGTAVTAGEALTSTQLAGLQFTPATGAFSVSSSLGYTVTDPAGNSSAGAATLAIGPAIGNPVTTPGTLTVAPGQAATALGIQAPTDPNYAPSALTATVTALPSDGSVDLADGATQITLGQVLSAAQLTSLTFLPATGASNTQSSLGYTVVDPAGNASNNSFTLAIGAGSSGSSTGQSGTASAPPPPVLTPGNLLSDYATPAVSGTAVAGSTVTLLSNGMSVATATASATGAFTAVPTSALPLGPNALTATATTSGGVSAASLPVELFETPTQVNSLSIPDNSTRDVVTALGQNFGLELTSGTQAVELLDGTISVSPMTNEGFLARLYEGLFGRSPDPATGYADDQFAMGFNHAQVATEFLASHEGTADFAGLSNSVFISTITQGLLGRSFSAADQSAFTNLLNNGVSRGVVLEGIADSAESQAYLSPLTSDVFIPRPTSAAVYEMYQTGLGRDGELSGVQFASNEVLQGGLSLLQVAQQIASTPEFLADHASQSNASYVSSLYQGGLGRATDPAGAALTSALNAAQITRGDALYAVATSSEAAAYLTRYIT